jgi:FMN reductase
MTPRSLVVVSAGLSQPSATRLLADRLTAATERLLAEADIQARPEVLELREHAQDLVNNLLTAFPGPRLRAATDKVMAADGLICVTPIFNASYSGLFKMFFDVLELDSLSGKPTLIAASGGTARHSLALEHAVRPLFAYLNAATVPTAVYAAPEDWGERSDDPGGDLVDRIERAAGELARAMAQAPSAPPPDPFEEPVPFERLLGGSDARRPRARE